jgi:hypothetical protein
MSRREDQGWKWVGGTVVIAALLIALLLMVL